MRVKGLDGREHAWTLAGREVSLDDPRQRSGPHLAARTLLKRLHPLAPVLEEVPLPGSDGLRLDFYVPSERLAVEVHGSQHFNYTPHFHGTRMGFLAAKRRDNRKAEWCRMNGIRLVILPDTETDGEWRRRLCGEAGE